LSAKAPDVFVQPAMLIPRYRILDWLGTSDFRYGVFKSMKKIDANDESQ
jgi:hypothetical protein